VALGGFREGSWWDWVPPSFLDARINPGTDWGGAGQRVPTPFLCQAWDFPSADKDGVCCLFEKGWEAQLLPSLLSRAIKKVLQGHLKKTANI